MSNTTEKKDRCLKLKRETAKIFNSKCIGCEKEYDHSFAFHHLKYVDGEKTYLDFDNTIDYNLYVLPIIKKEPERFRLVCIKCHDIVEVGKKSDFSKLNQCYTLSKKILPVFIKQYCDIWVSHETDLKQFFRAVFAGRSNLMSSRFLKEINNGSLDKWEPNGLDDFWVDKGDIDED